MPKERVHGVPSRYVVIDMPAGAGTVAAQSSVNRSDRKPRRPRQPQPEQMTGLY